MADTNNTKKQKKAAPNPLIGSQAQPTILDDKLKLDIDTKNTLMDLIIDAGIAHTLDTSELEKFTTISNARDQIYQTIDTMLRDSSVSSIVRTYVDEVCEPADNGHIIWCESKDPNISKFVNYLLNVMNADKHMSAWAWSLIVYGDLYLRLFRESDYEDKLFNKANIKNAYSARNVLNEAAAQELAGDLAEAVNINLRSRADHYSYYVEAMPDPGTMYELTRFGQTMGYAETPNAKVGYDFSDTIAGASNLNVYNYRMKTNDVILHQADDFVHACLEEGVSRFPEEVSFFTNEEDFEAGTGTMAYQVKRGKSMLYDSYKIWREKTLLESSVLLTRVTRSSMIQKVQYEVGDMPKEQVKATGRRLKELFEQQTAIDPNRSMGEYTNPGAIINRVYIPTHGGQGAVSVEAIGGDVNVKDLADLDDWTNRYYSSFGVPKAYFGYTDDGAGFNGGTSLAIISSIFAKGVRRVQNALIQAITDIINLFLLDRGYRSYLNNFVLKMKVPVTQEEKDERDALTNKISAVSNAVSLFADVENKARKLKILKGIIGPLNFGDEVVGELQKEIDEAEAQAQADKEAAEAEAQANEAMGAEGTTSTAAEETDNEADEDIDLGMASVATEALNTESDTTILAEDLVEDVIVEEDALPTPEELADNIDFTENN